MQIRMDLLWKPENWAERLEELQSFDPERKEAPLRRDVRSLGTLLGRVLREQAGDALFQAVEDLRRLTTDGREARLQGDLKKADFLLAEAIARIATCDTGFAEQLTRAFAFYFELINLAETNHRKRRRRAHRLLGKPNPAPARRNARNPTPHARGRHHRQRSHGFSGENLRHPGVHRSSNGGRPTLRPVQAETPRRDPGKSQSNSSAG